MSWRPSSPEGAARETRKTRAALETGDVEPLIRLLVDAMEKGVRQRCIQARAARNHATNDGEAGRRVRRGLPGRTKAEKAGATIANGEAGSHPHRRDRFGRLQRGHAVDERRETQAVARLDHPNSVTLHEVGDYRGRPYVVMQYVDGPSLAEFSRGRRLTAGTVLDLGVQLCAGLQAAHEQGVVLYELLADPGARRAFAVDASPQGRPVAGWSAP